MRKRLREYRLLPLCRPQADGPVEKFRSHVLAHRPNAKKPRTAWWKVEKTEGIEHDAPAIASADKRGLVDHRYAFDAALDELLRIALLLLALLRPVVVVHAIEVVVPSALPATSEHELGLFGNLPVSNCLVASTRTNSGLPAQRIEGKDRRLVPEERFDVAHSRQVEEL